MNQINFSIIEWMITSLLLQESIVICVEAEKEAPVAPYFCDPDRRLEIEVRTCNENPCPPRWNVSDFTTCSKSCGGGTQSRGVQCIQVLGRDLWRKLEGKL